MHESMTLQMERLKLRLIRTQIELLRYQERELDANVRALSQMHPAPPGLNLDGGPANPPGPP